MVGLDLQREENVLAANRMNAQFLEHTELIREPHLWQAAWPWAATQPLFPLASSVKGGRTRLTGLL